MMPRIVDIHEGGKAGDATWCLDPPFANRIAADDLALDAGLGLDASFADRAGTTALALLAELDLDVLVAERTGDLARGGVLDETGALAVAETGAEVVTRGGRTATVGEERGGEPDPTSELACDFGFEEPASVDSSLYHKGSLQLKRLAK
ncbi:unnamed protein product [Phytophthora fragariaefolia]|uniref:Unnamed protein product n=1 Tax=Phytophthora fragariaefolia TaxID=1490495 RepID=A0A9W6YPP0_9STRA|nr:unnamed protein product [Phytophthora fragariaefolia]